MKIQKISFLFCLFFNFCFLSANKIVLTPGLTSQNDIQTVARVKDTLNYMIKFYNLGEPTESFCLKVMESVNGVCMSMLIGKVSGKNWDFYFCAPCCTAYLEFGAISDHLGNKFLMFALPIKMFGFSCFDAFAFKKELYSIVNYLRDFEEIPELLPGQGQESVQVVPEFAE